MSFVVCVCVCVCCVCVCVYVSVRDQTGCLVTTIFHAQVRTRMGMQQEHSNYNPCFPSPNSGHYPWSQSVFATYFYLQIADTPETTP